MTIHTFNPRRMIDGVNIPMGVMMLDISQGAKILYGVLAKYNGSGISQKKIADLIGVSEKHVQQNLLKELYDEKLIQNEGRNPAVHEPTKYTFLWHKTFSSNTVRKPTPSIVGEAPPRPTPSKLGDHNIYNNSLSKNNSSRKYCPSDNTESSKKQKTVEPDKSNVQSGVRLKLKKKKLNPKTPASSVRDTPEIKEMISIWNATQFQTIKKYKTAQMEQMDQPTKRYIQIVEYLRHFLKGTLYGKFFPDIRLDPDNPDFKLGPQTVGDFRKYVDNLEKKAFDLQYGPQEHTKDVLKKTTLLSFLAGTPKFGHMPTLLTQGLTEPVLSYPVKPKNKILTEYLKECYQEMTHRQTNGKDHVTFIRAANQIQDFYMANRELLINYGCREPKLFVDNYFVPAILDNWGPNYIKKMRPAYLANPKALEEDVANLMLDKRTIAERDDLIFPY